VQQALVRYDERRQGSQVASVRAPKERDEHGNVIVWQVYPERHWTPTNREMWLSVAEARLWGRMRDWRIVQTREVTNGESANQRGSNGMLEGLVKYVGKRRGKFCQRAGRFPVREWAGRHFEMWLSMEEAELWAKQKDWRVVRTRIVASEADDAGGAQVAAPAPPAQHVSTLLTEQASFAMSDQGVVHKSGCVNWPKYPLKTFDTFADAVNDEDFGREHKLCCKGEMATLKQQGELKEELEQFKGAMAQMNSLGESYGIDQREA